MIETVTVISSIYGGYDEPVPIPEQTMPFEYVLVTDETHPRPHLHPRMAAKVAKCRPDLYTDADVIIWIDGSIIVKDEHFIEWAMRESEGWFISQLAHPMRDDIIHEAEASIGLLKYRGMDVMGQAEHYVKEGLPRRSGLWATGFIVYRPGTRFTSTFAMFGDMWLREQCRWTYQDQISEPFVAHQFGFQPHTIPGDLFNPPHFGLRAHRDER